MTNFVVITNVVIMKVSLYFRGGRVVRWCWVNFQCWGVLLIWIGVGQGPTALAVGAGAGGGCLDIFSLVYHFSFLSPSFRETARYILKYCLKGPLIAQNNQPTESLYFVRKHADDSGKGDIKSR